MNLTVLVLPVLLLVVVLYCSWVRYWDKEEQEFLKRVHDRTNARLDRMLGPKQTRMKAIDKEGSNS